MAKPEDHLRGRIGMRQLVDAMKAANLPLRIGGRRLEGREGAIADAPGQAGRLWTFPAILLSSTRDGNRWRWNYTAIRLRKSGAQGYSGWVIYGSDVLDCYNLIEQPNGQSGTAGNGVNLDNLVGTGFELQPAPNLVLVWLTEIRTATGPLDYWFQYENGVDGECSGSLTAPQRSALLAMSGRFPAVEAAVNSSRYC